MARNNKQNKMDKKQRINKRNPLPPGGYTISKFSEPVPRGLPLPNVVRVTLKYSDFYLLASTSGIAYAVYSGNSVYDPDVSFTGHQPYYFDRYAALYNYYTVLNSKIRIRTNVDLGSNQSVMVGLIAYRSNGVGNNAAGLQEIMESKYGTSKLFINNPVQTFTLNNGQRTTTMLCTSENELINNITYRTAVTTSPTQEWYYKLLALNGDNSTSSFSLAMAIEIEYDVVFSVLQDESPSFYKEQKVTSKSRINDSNCEKRVLDRAQ